MIKNNWYSNDLGMLARQAISAWLILFSSVIVFTFLSLVLSLVFFDKTLIIAISLLVVTPCMIWVYLRLQRNRYSGLFSHELLNKHDVTSTSVVEKDDDTEINFIGKTDFISIPITLSVASDSILSSPTIGKIFTRAVLNTIYEYIGQTFLELHSHKIELQVRKLTGTAKIIAKVLREVEENRDFPNEVKIELQRRLYDIFYKQMEEFAQEIKMDEFAREIKMRNVDLGLEHIMVETEMLKLELSDSSKTDVEYPIILVGEENKIKAKKK